MSHRTVKSRTIANSEPHGAATFGLQFDFTDLDLWDFPARMCNHGTEGLDRVRLDFSGRPDHQLVEQLIAPIGMAWADGNRSRPRTWV